MVLVQSQCPQCWAEWGGKTVLVSVFIAILFAASHNALEEKNQAKNISITFHLRLSLTSAPPQTVTTEHVDQGVLRLKSCFLGT